VAMRITRSRWWGTAAALVVIFAIGGIAGGLLVVAGMVVGIAVGVALVLAYGFLEHRLRR